jgi:hypothetical protein
MVEKIGPAAKRLSRPLHSTARPPLREENRVVEAYLGAGLSSKSSRPTRNTKGPLAPESSAARIGPFRCRTLGRRSTRRSNAGATCRAYFGGKAGSRISGQSERVRAHVARPSGSRRSSASPGACQAEFPGSRLCSSMEVMETTAIPDLEGNAWVRPSFISTIDRSVLDASGLVLLGGPPSNCDQWKGSASTGTVAATSPPGPRFPVASRTRSPVALWLRRVRVPSAPR